MGDRRCTLTKVLADFRFPSFVLCNKKKIKQNNIQGFLVWGETTTTTTKKKKKKIVFYGYKH